MKHEITRWSECGSWEDECYRRQQDRLAGIRSAWEEAELSDREQVAKEQHLIYSIDERLLWEDIKAEK